MKANYIYYMHELRNKENNDWLSSYASIDKKLTIIPDGWELTGFVYILTTNENGEIRKMVPHGERIMIPRELLYDR